MVVIVGVIVTAAALIPRSVPAVQLPPYLDRCVTSVTYHYHPGLVININGSQFPIPADVGRQGSCDRPIHTHPPGTNPSSSVYDGTLHVESDDPRDYTLGDFFLIWGNSVNNANFAIFNSNQIFTNHVDATHPLTITINGTPYTQVQPNTPPEKIVFAKNADPQSNPFNIVVTYAAPATY